MKGLRYPTVALLTLTAVVSGFCVSAGQSPATLEEQDDPLPVVTSLMASPAQMDDLSSPAMVVFEAPGGIDFKTVLGDKKQTRRFLELGLVSGRITFEQSGRTRVTALDGRVFEAGVDKEVKVADATVSADGIWYSNGVIHVIEECAWAGSRLNRG
jgi:uncharacterized surface protein with fasciclin (FAS1) repeats